MVPKTENGQTVLVKVGRPLTASNEHELRKKMQNRVSAIEARMRKKRKMEELEEKVNALTKENEKLRIENARLSCKGTAFRIWELPANGNQPFTSPNKPLKLNPNRIVSYSYRGQGRSPCIIQLGDH